MNISRSSMDMQKRNFPVKFVRRNSIPWLMCGNTWLVSFFCLFSLTPVISPVLWCVLCLGLGRCEELPFFHQRWLVWNRMQHAFSRHQQIRWHGLPHPGLSTLLFRFLLRTLLLELCNVECQKWRWHDHFTVGHVALPAWAFQLTYFECTCVLCCSTHERHAIYMWNLWKILQTQYVTQGALLAAFWREALQMWGKEC